MFLRNISIADAAEAATMSPRSLAKQLNVGNTAQLERRIKRELEEQGRCHWYSNITTFHSNEHPGIHSRPEILNAVVYLQLAATQTL